MFSKAKSALLTALLATLFALAALPMTAAASESASGYIPVNKEVYTGEGAQTPSLRGATPADSLPSTYRSDTQPWAANITVKDQGSTGLCWAISTATTLDYSYAKELYDTYGIVATAEETSGSHIAQFLYNRVDDPLGNTANDANKILISDHWSYYGGNEIYAMQHLASWSGACLDSKAPLSATVDNVDKSGKWTGASSGLAYSEDLAYDDAVTLQESIYLKLADINTMKELVYKYGAVSVGISAKTAYFNQNEIDPETGEAYPLGRSFYCYEEGTAINHSVPIVGWDDNYPKENFTHSVKGMSDTKAYALTTPENDGAWIVQNSYGDSNYDDGFIYISYESLDICGDDFTLFAFDMQPADAYAYNFQYDGTAFCSDSSEMNRGRHYDYYTIKGTRAANVFTNTTGAPVSVEAVGFTTYNAFTTNYEIAVYTGLTSANDPTSGTLAASVSCTTTTAGCKTVELDKAVTVPAGQSFSVVFTFSRITAFGVEMAYKDSDLSIVAETKAGQSFFSAADSDTWLDMNDYNACFRIKAFANAGGSETHAPGWAKENGSWYYYKADGTLLKDGWASYEGVSYYFGADGKLVQEGWATYEGVTVYIKDYRVVKDGWVSYQGTWYYIKNYQAIQNGWVSYQGSSYYFGADGKLVQEGWASYQGVSYYIRDYHVLKEGWASYEGTWYYIKNYRVMQEGWATYGDKYFYYKNYSLVKDDWVSYNGTWYHFDSSGVCDRSVKG